MMENYDVISDFSFLRYIKPFECRVLKKYNIFSIISYSAVIYYDKFKKMTQLLRPLPMKKRDQESPCRTGLSSISNE